MLSNIIEIWIINFDFLNLKQLSHGGEINCIQLSSEEITNKEIHNVFRQFLGKFCFRENQFWFLVQLLKKMTVGT